MANKDINGAVALSILTVLILLIPMQQTCGCEPMCSCAKATPLLHTSDHVITEGYHRPSPLGLTQAQGPTKRRRSRTRLLGYQR